MSGVTELENRMPTRQKPHFMDINSDIYCSRQNTKILLTENNKANYDFPEDVCEVDSSPHHRSFRIKRASRGPWIPPMLLTNSA